MKDTFLIFLRGIAMGIADLVPGVSGGTIALITGIYERLIKSVKELNIRWFYHYCRFFFLGKVASLHKARTEFKRIDWALFLPLGAGIAFAILTGAHAVDFFFETYPVQTILLFVGLIISSIFLVMKKTVTWHARMLIGLAIGLGLALIAPTQGSNNMLYVAFSGFIAISALFLPGVSGSYLLLVLGKYRDIIDAIKDPFGNIGIIITFGIGALVGMIFISRVITYLLKKHHDPTLQILIGLVFGSLILPFRQIRELGIEPNWTLGAIFTLIGIGLPFLVQAIVSFSKRQRNIYK